MAKTSFTRVEEALQKGIKEMEMERLKHAATPHSKEKQSKEKKTEIEKMFMKIDFESNRLYKRDPHFFTAIGIEKKEIKRLLKLGPLGTAEDIALAEQILAKIEQYKQMPEHKATQNEDEKIIESQRKKHHTKRFNVNDRWLPLK